MLITVTRHKYHIQTDLRCLGFIASLLPRLPKLPALFEQHWLGNLGNLGNKKEIQP